MLWALLGALFAAAAGAQEILPFPLTPSGSTAGLTIESSSYKKRVEPQRLAGWTQQTHCALAQKQLTAKR